MPVKSKYRARFGRDEAFQTRTRNPKVKLPAKKSAAHGLSDALLTRHWAVVPTQARTISVPLLDAPLTGKPVESNVQMIVRSVERQLAQWQHGGRIQRAASPVISEEDGCFGIDISVWVNSEDWMEGKHRDLTRALFHFSTPSVTVVPRIYPYAEVRAG